MAQVKTVEYGEVFGVYILGFKKMDAHMAEMMNEGWTVQSTQTWDAGKEFFRAQSAPAYLRQELMRLSPCSFRRS